MLLGWGAHVNAADNEGRTPLHLSSGPELAFNRHVEVSQMLVGAGADVDAVNKDGNTPLHESASSYNGSLEVSQMLVRAGANINAKNNKGKTPLDGAKRSRAQAVVEWLQQAQESEALALTKSAAQVGADNSAPLR